MTYFQYLSVYDTNYHVHCKFYYYSVCDIAEGYHTDYPRCPGVTDSVRKDKHLDHMNWLIREPRCQDAKIITW